MVEITGSNISPLTINGGGKAPMSFAFGTE